MKRSKHLHQKNMVALKFTFSWKEVLQRISIFNVFSDLCCLLLAIGYKLSASGYELLGIFYLQKYKSPLFSREYSYD